MVRNVLNFVCVVVRLTSTAAERVVLLQVDRVGFARVALQPLHVLLALALAARVARGAQAPGHVASTRNAPATEQQHISTGTTVYAAKDGLTKVEDSTLRPIGSQGRLT